MLLCSYASKCNAYITIIMYYYACYILDILFSFFLVNILYSSLLNFVKCSMVDAGFFRVLVWIDVWRSIHTTPQLCCVTNTCVYQLISAASHRSFTALKLQWMFLSCNATMQDIANSVLQGVVWQRNTIGMQYGQTSNHEDLQQ